MSLKNALKEGYVAEFSRPSVFSSKCLGFDTCRYNGVAIPCETVEKLKPFVDYITHCPEVEIGLGVPRATIRVIEENGQLELYQPETGKIFTREMSHYTARTLDNLPPVDGFILKHKSPSCGQADVKLFRGRENKSPVKRVAGFFGGEVARRFEGLAIEDEGRLSNFTIRERFLISIFTHAKFRSIRAKARNKDLVSFHSQNKLLFMACNQAALKQLGKIVANEAKLAPADVYNAYYPPMLRLLNSGPQRTQTINVLMHALGYFKKQLNTKEKAHFLDMLESYRERKVPLSAITSVLRSWTMRLESPYLDMQTFFMPYPPELMDINDSGKGRDY
jgi:uncharacterized protein YbgA (DUF1722 family)/uncharacterized protein YbbK (DUF523 family)